MASFLLTFYEQCVTTDRGCRHHFVKEKTRLQILAETSKRGSQQLICFLHGPGGSGKTTVVDLIMEYAREYCSNLPDFEFSSRTIVVTAMTGVAATILLGETLHSAAYLNQKREITPEQVDLWRHSRLLIIDEISFASKSEIVELHKKLRRLKQQLNLPYGGLHIVFAGDLRQLESVGIGKKPLYADHCPEFEDWINSYIELNGMHRFRDDLAWGEKLYKFRDGTVSEDDINNINDNIVVNDETVLPDNIRYATYFNADRDAINAALFETRCVCYYNTHGHTNDSIMIFSDGIEVQGSNKKYSDFKHKRYFWENCAEDDIKLPKGEGRMDPVLKLYKGCRVMMSTNVDVLKGQANGTQAVVEKIVLKPDTTVRMTMLEGAVQVASVTASDISCIVLKHVNDRISPALFSLKPKKHTFKARLPKPRLLQTKTNDKESVKMKATQVPLLVNNATTGHKLQGASVTHLFVHNWSYVTNWVYVMLSRVRTQPGLFARHKLTTDMTKYAVPKTLLRLLDRLRSHAPTYWSDEEYEELFL